MSIIKVNNLTTKFGNRVIHDKISFQVNQGEIFGVLGGSGSGKTTLIKQIVMLQEIQEGEIFFLNKNISNITMKDSLEIKNNFSYLFQFGALYSFLNVLENIEVMLKEYTNLPIELIQEVALTNLKLVGLKEEHANLYPSELSGGMKKRVALARAIAIDPKVLFLDEPTSGLDPSSADQFNELILNLKKMLNLTIIIITHDLKTIKNTLDRFIIINDANIVFNGDITTALNKNDIFLNDFLTIKKDEKNGY
ncbi:ABC transporter ATP-binding protein [Arcobacter sp. CECT 8985]|uniref:ABC transporter ATP-binding protein n=1 Tax=Arcobacter sp. CECT 8985 TaxID=1935424 RepID=UPI00100AB27C|nr:ATP-binding cassette domain-containing protein [Arcobacter sp. CECT 8985]RXJ83737.1 sulfate ABC transporter ATP-binding protein [Arcobacter sp. CECT 8985]